MSYEPERPDDSGEYDDETLIAIIVERAERSGDPITARDVRWLGWMADKQLTA